MDVPVLNGNGKGFFSMVFIYYDIAYIHYIARTDNNLFS